MLKPEIFIPSSDFPLNHARYYSDFNSGRSVHPSGGGWLRGLSLMVTAHGVVAVHRYFTQLSFRKKPCESFCDHAAFAGLKLKVG